MRTLFMYLRQCFCKHEWQVAEAEAEITKVDYRKKGLKVSIFCKKCGYHKSFWKF